MKEFRSLERQDLNENFDLLAMALAGDIQLHLSQSTAAPTAAQCAAADQVYKIDIDVRTAAGDIHNWYEGKVLLAIGDDDSTGVAEIDPVAGEISMVNGRASVTVTLPKAVWTATKAATLTVSKPVTAKAPIMEIVAAKTFVATVAA